MRAFLALLFSAAAYAAPCITATPACTEFVTLGAGPARTMVYRTQPLTVKNEKITRALIVIHGTNRDADNYFRSTLAAAFLADALDDTVLIVPHIASAAGSCKDTLAPNEVSWNCASWRTGGASVADDKLTTFDMVDEILRRLARKDSFPNLKSIVVAGHSAGGQFVNRYEMSNRVHETLGLPVTYVVANPSSYAWIDATRPASVADACANLRLSESFRIRGAHQRRGSQEATRRAAHDLPAWRNRHSAAGRLRFFLLRHAARTYQAGARPGIRHIRRRATGREARHRGSASLRPQRPLHVHRGNRAAAVVPEVRAPPREGSALKIPAGFGSHRPEAAPAGPMKSE
jgi:hypothetical protein